MLGQFPRGFDSGGSVDPGRAFGSTQADQMQGHLHGPGAGGVTNYIGQNGAGANLTVGGGNDGITTNTGSPVSDGTNGAPRTGKETRPTNVALNFIIKI
jgi:hypothetical protein